MRYQGQSYTLQIDFSLAEAAAWNSFAQLADRFHECRVALNRLAEEYVDLGDSRYVPPL